MKDELYINGQEIELDQSEAVGFTYQVYSIAQIEPLAAYSNQFVVPLTNRNAHVLNFSNTVQTNTLAPYRQLGCTFIRGGVVIVENGVAIIEGSQGNFQVTIYSAIFDFFQQISDLSLKDIDWSYLNHLYDLSTLKTINENWCAGNSVISWPLIQWGQYVLDQDVDIRYQQPCINFSEIITKIFSKTTYSKSGEIFDDPLYKDMAMTLNPDEYPADPDVILARSYKATMPSGTVITDLGIPGDGDEKRAPFFNLLSYFSNTTTPGINTGLIFIDTDPTHPFRVATGASWAPQKTLSQTAYKSTVYQTIDINVKLTIKNSFIQDGYNYYAILKNNVNVHQVNLSLDALDGFHDDFTLDVIPGDAVYIQLRLGYFTAEGDVDTGLAIKKFQISSDNLADNFLSITPVASTPLNGALNYNYLMPNLKLTDIIKSFCQQFAIILTPENKNIVFTKFLEIKKNIANAEDWSNKLDLSQPPLITYRIDGYAQNNNLRYLADDVTSGFGDSSFTINDNVIAKNIDLFQLIYPSCLPVDNIRTTAFKFFILPVPQYSLFPQWKPYTRRNVFDIVAYNNILYRCITAIPITDYGQLDNIHNWQVLNGDVVPGNIASQILQYQTSQPNQGVQIPRYTLIQAAAWVFDTTYGNGDQVNYGGIIYESKIDNNININPPSSPLSWKVVVIQFEQSATSPSRLVLLRPISRVDVPGYVFYSVIKYTDGVSTLASNTAKYPMAYFSDTQEVYNITFQYLIPNYWQQVINMLNQLKVLQCLIKLSDLDILELDFLTLKYISHFNNHFYLTVVNQYLSGQSTQCELIRM